jgi:hypothetical protein
VSDTKPVTRAEIAAMSLAEFDEREAELLRWEGAGAKDGEPAPPGPERPAGHTFTRDEIAGMTLVEYEANESAIDAQRKAAGIR